MNILPNFHLLLTITCHLDAILLSVRHVHVTLVDQSKHMLLL